MLEFENQIGGMYAIYVAKAGKDGAELEGSRRLVCDWQNNLITDTGMNFIGGAGNSPYQFLSFVSVGSSATAPAFTDTALGARVATTSSFGSSTAFGFTTSSPFYSWFRREFTFAVGQAAGVLSELGVTSSNGALAYTRALIRDGLGNPTTITVLSDEILIVTYEIRVYPNTSEVVTSATIKGVPTTVTIRPCELGLPGGMTGGGDIAWGTTGNQIWFTGGASPGVGPNTGIPTGTSNTLASTLTNHPYVSNSFALEQTFGLGLSQLAGTTITGFRGRSVSCCYQIGFSPGVPKTSSETVNLRLRMSWARYTP